MERWRRTWKKYIGLLMVGLLCLAGASLRAGAADAGARLLEVEGCVLVQNGSGRSLERFADMKLPNGSRVEAGKESRARIGIGSEGELALACQSAVELRTQGNVPELLLEKGVLSFSLSEKDAPVNLRTATAALAGKGADGWICAVDGNHTLLCLEEGEMRLSVTDPLSGQVKTARLTGGKAAECIVYPLEEGEERCAIWLRDLTQADREASACGVAGAANAKGEDVELTALRDPVWTEEDILSGLLADGEGFEPQEEKGDSDNEGGNQGGYIPGSLTPSWPYRPIQGILPEELTLASTPEPGHSSGSGSHGSSSSSAPSAPTPSTPSQDVADATEDRGLVLEGIRENQGTIVVERGGKVTIVGASADRTLINRKEIVNRGEIDGIVVNASDSDASFLMEEGSVARVENRGVQGRAGAQGAPLIEIRGGTVTEGVRVESGRLSMVGGMVKAPRGAGESALLVDGGAASIQGGTVKNEYGGAALFVKNGRASITNEAAIQAREPLKTLELSPGGAAVADYSTVEKASFQAAAGANGLPAFYVTAKQGGSLVELRALTDSLEQVVNVINNGRGDTITLAGDLTEADDEEIQAKGGTASSPVVLDLNGKTLALKTDNWRVLTLVGGASWEIQGRGKAGNLLLENMGIAVMGDSMLQVTDAVVEGQWSYLELGSENEKNSKATISGSTISGVGIGQYGEGGQLEVVDSELNGFHGEELQVDAGQLEIQKSTISCGVMNSGNAVISDSAIAGYVYNGGVLTVSHSEIKTGSDGQGGDLENEGRVAVSGSKIEGWVTNTENGVVTLSEGTVVAGIDNRSGNSTVEIRDSTVEGTISSITESQDSSRVCRVRVEDSTVGGGLQCCAGTDGSSIKAKAMIEVSNSEITGGISAESNGSVELSDSQVSEGAIETLWGDVSLSGSTVSVDSIRLEGNGQHQICDGCNIRVKDMYVRGGELAITNSTVEFDVYIGGDEATGKLLIEGGGRVNLADGSTMKDAYQISVNDGGGLVASGSRVTVGEGGVRLMSEDDKPGTSSIVLEQGAVMDIQDGGGTLTDESSKITIQDATLKGRVILSGVPTDMFTWENADIYYKGTEPAVALEWMDSTEQPWMWEGLKGSITNDGTGAGLRVVSPKSEDEMDKMEKAEWSGWLGKIHGAFTIRTKDGSPIEVGKADSGYGMPQGYTLQTGSDGYHYLIQPPANAVAQSAAAALEPEITEGSKGENGTERTGGFVESTGGTEASAEPEEDKGQEKEPEAEQKSPDALLPTDSEEPAAGGADSGDSDSGDANTGGTDSGGADSKEADGTDERLFGEEETEGA